MNPALLAALINEVALPELTRWLTGLHQAGETVTEAAIVQKLLADTDIGIRLGEAWLAAHPVMPLAAVPNLSLPTQG